MSQAKKFEDLYPRAPRYVIEVGDHQVVRFAQLPKGSKTMHTRIINLSESGMAFLVPYHTSPEPEEHIKVEFSPPNAQPIACFAKVVRVELHKTYSEDQRPQTFKLVAVEFVQMHPLQRQLLAQGLTEKFRENFEQFKKEQFWLKWKWRLSRLWNRLVHSTKNLGKKKQSLQKIKDEDQR
jgi:hypothetical protein